MKIFVKKISIFLFFKDINLYVVKVGVAIYLDLLGMPFSLFVNLRNALLGHATPRTPAMYFNLFAVLRIHDILGWIRIRGSMPLTNGSGSGSRIRILLFLSWTFKMPA
jgi:hypothetical protein